MSGESGSLPSPTVLARRIGATFQITLNRPAKRNAFDGEMRLRLLAVLEEAAVDAGIKAVAIHGAGEHFCAGGDIGQMGGREPSAIEARDRIRLVQRITSTILNMEKPVIAAVDGVAFGGGLSIALAADFAVGTPRAKLCASFMRIGLVPDMSCMYVLPRLVGLARAKDIVMTGRVLEAGEAHRLGLLHSVVEPHELLSKALEVAGRFHHASTVALGLAKRLLTQSFQKDEASVAELEALTQAALLTTEYHKSCVERFLRKEPLPFVWPAGE